MIDVRRIEVKGYTRGNDIQLTTNEWYKAQQLGPTYWLCVVWDPLEDEPRTGQHPQPGRETRPREVKHREMIRRYEIPAEAIDRYAEKGKP